MTSPPHSLEQAPQEPKPNVGAGAIPLPDTPPATASANPRRGRGLNAILTILVLTFAFLAASFVAHNSDLWFHLATGRLLAHGEFPFGADPFAYTTTNVYWACHSWLFDWTLYGLRGLIHDSGLVAFKALIVAVLAGLLLSIRPARSLRLSAFCTTLAILSMSPRLLLRPACVSYFLLGLTFWLLWRPHTQNNRSRMSLFFLPLVFILWVNVDEWFFLGPLLVALFWLGERMGGPRPTPGWLVLVGLAVCLLNPFTYHAFTLPAELSIVPWTSGLLQDARFRIAFASPWASVHLHAAAHFHAAFLAYYALTLLGLVSFLLNRSALRDWRLLVWLPFALLAVWQARLIPFFAVVAAPIAVLNLSPKYEQLSTKRPIVLGVSSLLLLLGMVALISLTWMGWLAGYDREERHVAWGVQEDPSLRRVATTLDTWRRQGLLPEGERVFALSPEVVHYCAWFCPGVKHFFDHRYPLFSEVARDYETVYSALLTAPRSETNSAKDVQKQPSTDWQNVLREHQVRVVIFYDLDWQRLFSILNRPGSDTENWIVLDIAGQALIACWNEARSDGSFSSLAFDPNQLAFGLQDGKAPHQAPVAPEQGPTQLPNRRDLWERLAHPPASPTVDSAAAAAYVTYFLSMEGSKQESQRLQLISLSNFAASLAGLPVQSSGVTQAAFQVFSSRKLLFPEEANPPRFREDFGPYFASMVDRAPALPLLAIRAARQGVAANPHEANAWLQLGHAYLLLRDGTCERSAEGLLPPLVQMRHVQIATALEQAVRLDPNLEAAHRELAFLYGPSNALDRALEHRREELRLSREAGPRPGESRKEFNYRLDLLDKDTAKLVTLVEDNRKKFAASVRSFQGNRVAQADQALKKWGLARQAVEEILMATPADVLGAAGIRLELETLLALGRAQEVRSILNDRDVRASKHGLGFSDIVAGVDNGRVRLYSQWPAYEWLHVLEAAAVGDYAVCRDDLRTLRAMQQGRLEQVRLQSRNFQSSVQTLAPGLMSGPPPLLPAFLAWRLAYAVEEKLAIEAALRGMQAQQADLCVLEGLLALEQGDVSIARAVFAEAMKLGADTPFAGRPIAAYYLGKLTNLNRDR